MTETDPIPRSLLIVIFTLAIIGAVGSTTRLMEGDSNLLTNPRAEQVYEK